MTFVPGLSRPPPRKTMLSYADTTEPVIELPEAAGGSAAIAQTLNELVRGFSEQVAIVDEDWTIVAVNDAWKQMIHVAGYPELTPGTNYRDFLKAFTLRGHENAVAVMNGVNAIDAGESNSFQLTYAGIDQWEGRMLRLRINRLHIEGRALATITRQDITDSVELRRLREQFSSCVLESQAEERRRFGRELHDSTAQLLTSMGLLLFTLKHRSPRIDSLGVVEELRELVSEAQQEIRSACYHAHPPALDKMSLADAVKALVEGFARRTGLRISFQQRGNAIRLSRVGEGALYRIAQEGLANVHRHAKAERVRVCIFFTKSVARLVIIDDGIGISPATLAGSRRAGVGLSGMRSRLEEIGGRLSIRRLTPGTAVCASVSISQES
jgi:signal transduction histidine kinase